MTSNPQPSSQGQDPVPNQIGPQVTMSLLTLVVAVVVIGLIYMGFHAYGLQAIGYMLNVFFADMSAQMNAFFAN